MKRKIAIWMVLVLLVMPVCAAAVEGEWVLSPDKQVLTHEDTTYQRYYLNPADVFLAREYRILDETGNIDVDGEIYQVIRVTGNDGIVMLEPEYSYHLSYNQLYVSQEQKQNVEDFLDEKFYGYLFGEHSSTESTVITPEQVAELDAMQTNTSVDVRQLADAICYEIVGTDATETLGHIHGAVYISHDGEYYLNYDNLDNSYFSSDGSFSYRDGTVELAALDGAAMVKIDRLVERITDREMTARYESDDFDPGVEQDVAPFIFWTLTVVLGVILPAIPLTFGLVYALRGKCLYPKRWFVLVALSAAWMVIMGTIVMILL